MAAVRTRWIKRGRIFQVDGQQPWMAHHAAIPTPNLLEDDTVRIYFGPRDQHGRTRTTYLDADAADPARITYLHDRPVLDLGRLGTFDDSGAMPSCVVDVDGEKWLYYIGWNVGVTVPYRNAIGLAVSTDGGVSFERAFEGPVVDRNRDEPFFTATPFVLREPGGWRMWYASTIEFLRVDERVEPVYVIKYAESDDGVVWRRDNVTCVAPRLPDEASARPWVVRDGDIYRMWFSYRGGTRYREDRSRSYRVGYAESRDGIVWDRHDEPAGLGRSDEGWDSEMVEYPGVYEYRGTRHMLYNGNGFGLTGFGHAVAAA
jgi:hypothetical protein